MPTASETTAIPRYTIKNVSKKTGILPVTIRAWERRYEFLSPHRSENRYRMYSDSDVALLMWIKNRVDQGVSISTAVNELHTLQNNGFIPEIKQEYQSAYPKPTGIPPAEYAARLNRAFKKSNEIEAAEIFAEARAAFNLPALLASVLIPTLTQIGEAWYRGEIDVAIEHFASKFIIGKLMHIFQTLPLRAKREFIIIGCAPDEFHEIGSLMLAILLRSQGYRIDYLGADIPLDDLVDFVESEKPAMVILSVTMQGAAKYVEIASQQIAALKKAPLFGYGGAIFISQPKLRLQVKGTYLGDSINSAVETIEKLFPGK
ncbi:MAG TPA: MerR family transcriptional regulator [Anaerolineaceae bacterium]|nr:MerR family transcriptional regulator [Anaerolineaceae bacterium]HQP07858.1 MerR family transcriptional regulator [Anaerolineaceae bacterium]